MASTSREREHWNQRYQNDPGSWLVTDEFLQAAFPQFIEPRFPHGGSALDLAGGAGRNSIWLAQHGWSVTLLDISDVGVEQAKRNAGSWSSRIQFVVDDLTRFGGSQTQYDLVMAFFYLDRDLFPEIVKAVRPGGLLMYKTCTVEQLNLPGGPEDRAHLLEHGELLRLAEGLQVLHYREAIGKKATAEIVALKAK